MDGPRRGGRPKNSTHTSPSAQLIVVRVQNWRGVITEHWLIEPMVGISGMQNYLK